MGWWDMEGLKDEGEGKLLSQCPKCLAVLIKYPLDKYGPRSQNSIVLFNKFKKELCLACKEDDHSL